MRLPRDANTLERITFTGTTIGAVYLQEVLGRFVPEHAMSVSQIDYDTVKISCYLSKSEFNLVKYILRRNVSCLSRDEYEIERFKEFLEEL